MPVLFQSLFNLFLISSFFFLSFFWGGGGVIGKMSIITLCLAISCIFGGDTLLVVLFMVNRRLYHTI